MNLSAFLANLALISTLLFTSGCTPFKDSHLSGTILHSTSSFFLLYEPQLGIAASTDWGDNQFNPSIICQSSDGGIILESETKFDFSLNDSVREHEYFLYKWFPGKSPELLADVTDHLRNVRSLKWYAEKNVYLAAGLVDSNWGVYTLDSAFNVLSELKITRGGVRVDRAINAAYLLNDSSMLINCVPQIYLMEGDAEPVVLWQNAHLIAVSHDRRKLLVSSGYKVNMKLEIYDLRDKSSSMLNISGKYVGSAGFSPDDRYIVIEWVTQNIGNTVRLMIYDTATGKLHDTNLVGGGELLWIPDRILSEFPVPFGEMTKFLTW